MLTVVTDVTLDSTNITYGGWVVQDHLGTAKIWKSSTFGTIFSSLEGETKTLLASQQICWIHIFRYIIFEGDSNTLNEVINNQTTNTIAATLVRDIHL